MSYIFFTVATESHLSGAFVTLNSLHRYFPDNKFIIYLECDDLCSKNLPFYYSKFEEYLHIEIKPVRVIRTRKLSKFASVTRLKYLVLRSLMKDQSGYAVYLDSDLFFTNSPASYLSAFCASGKSIGLTPHQLGCNPLTTVELAQETRYHSHFNAGFIAIRCGDANSIQILDSICKINGECFNLIDSISWGADQTVLNINVLRNLQAVYVFNDPELNVSYWNFSERSGSEEFFSRVAFWHFSKHEGIRGRFYCHPSVIDIYTNYCIELKVATGFKGHSKGTVSAAQQELMWIDDADECNLPSYFRVNDRIIQSRAITLLLSAIRYIRSILGR